MDFKELKELLGENSDAVSFVDTLETNTTNNVERINALEKSLDDTKTTRDKYKQGNSLVKSLLGLEQINEDTLNDFLSNNKGKTDETLSAELKNLKDMLEKTTTEKESIVSEYENKIGKMALDNEIALSGVGTLFQNEEMYKLGMGVIKQGATFENGEIVYKNEDGTTVYNGSSPMNLKDKVESLRSNPSYSGLFKGQTQGRNGGGMSNQANGSNFQPKSNMGGTKEERLQAIQEKFKG